MINILIDENEQYAFLNEVTTGSGKYIMDGKRTGQKEKATHLPLGGKDMHTTNMVIPINTKTNKPNVPAAVNAFCAIPETQSAPLPVNPVSDAPMPGILPNPVPDSPLPGVLPSPAPDSPMPGVLPSPTPDTPNPGARPGEPAQSAPADLTPAGQRPKNPRGNIQFLTVIGQIEGHMILPPNNKTTKYEHVIPQLVLSAESPEIEGLLILLNTVGGDVEAGLAIAELISHLGKPTVSLVLGGGHSIGVPLAVSADYSFIAPSATMTIHPVRMNGTVVGAPQTYDYFNKMQDRVLDFVVRNSRITRERLTALMMDTRKLVLDVGTILIGEEAVQEKIIDEVGGLYHAMEKLYGMIAEARQGNL